MSDIAFTSATPIFRIFDEELARSFYVDFLGFTVEFEHRFEDDLPLYQGLTLGDCSLHLSGHFGDCTPGSKVRIQTRNLVEFAEDLRKKNYKHCRPGNPCPTPWGEIDLTIVDPFGNKLTFWEAIPNKTS